MELFKTPDKIKKNGMFSTPVKIPASPFLETLGHGTGIVVYRMDRSPKINSIRSPWALKRTLKEMTNRNFETRLKNEAKVLRKLQHPNIVGFRAFVKMPDGRNCLAMENCEKSLGDLIEKRFDEQSGPFEENLILKMACDISNALNYLHTTVKIMHGDMKSYNILVKGVFEICKLCDFGVTIPLDAEGKINALENKHQYIGTKHWNAPEVIQNSIISYKADIFSFGLIIWEMLALKPPHMHIEEDEDENCTIENEDSIISISDEEDTVSCINENDNESFSQQNIPVNTESKLGTRPVLPFLSIDDYHTTIAIFYICTEENPLNRPDAKNIFNITQEIISKEINN